MSSHDYDEWKKKWSKRSLIDSLKRPYANGTKPKRIIEESIRKVRGSLSGDEQELFDELIRRLTHPGEG
jgi:hypothetical protein